MDKSLGGPVKPVWMLWRREKFLPLAGIETRAFSPQPVSVPTEMSGGLLTRQEAVCQNRLICEYILEYVILNLKVR
jgi:hypothetical protein